MPRTVSPLYRDAVKSIVEMQGIELVELDYQHQSGAIDPASLAQYEGQDFAALVIPFPNFFGVLEDVDALTRWAEARCTKTLQNQKSNAHDILYVKRSLVFLVLLYLPNISPKRPR